MMNINLEFFSGLKKNSIEFWYAKKCAAFEKKSDDSPIFGGGLTSVPLLLIQITIAQ